LIGLKSQHSSEQPIQRTSIGAVLAAVLDAGSTLGAPVVESGVLFDMAWFGFSKVGLKLKYKVRKKAFSKKERKSFERVVKKKA
jgi:hypothetical protein